jgi:hypothetical protein
VEGDVEVRIVDPGRPSLGQRDEREPLAIAGNEVQTRDDLPHELVVGGRRAFADDRAGNVHVRGPMLEVQERRVEPGEAVGGGHDDHSVSLADNKTCVIILTNAPDAACQPPGVSKYRPAESFSLRARTSGGPTAELMSAPADAPGRGESDA